MMEYNSKAIVFFITNAFVFTFCNFTLNIRSSGELIKKIPKFLDKQGYEYKSPLIGIFWQIKYISSSAEALIIFKILTRFSFSRKAYLFLEDLILIRLF